jgi:hypothetical protein
MGDPFQPIKPGEKFNKEIEKVKADNEKPVKEKFEKIEKHEFKEHKLEFKENKFEIKEIKGDKEKEKDKDKEKEGKEHFKGENKFEIKEIKIEKIEQREDLKQIEQKLVKEGKENEGPGLRDDLLTSPALDRQMLLRHADALESMGRELRHFIEQSDRPDLSRGALRDEPDQGNESSDDDH